MKNELTEKEQRLEQANEIACRILNEVEFKNPHYEIQAIEQVATYVLSQQYHQLDNKALDLEMTKELIKVMSKLCILVDKKVSDDLGVRLDLGTVFNKSQVLKEAEFLFEKYNLTDVYHSEPYIQSPLKEISEGESDLVELRKKYDNLIKHYDIEPKQYFDLIITDAFFDEDLKNEHNRKRFNSLEELEEYVKLNLKELDNDFIDCEIFKYPKIN